MDEQAGTWQDDGSQDSRDLTIQIVTWTLVVLAGLFVFVPGVNSLVPALLGLGPWALLLMVFLGNGRYLLYGRDGHTVMIGVLVLPIVLGMGCVLRFHMVDWRNALGPAIGMAVGFALLGAMANAGAVAARPSAIADTRRGGPIALLIAGGFLGWATLIDANAAAQTAAPATQTVTIAHKWVSGGKSRTPYFTFADAPALGITNFDVSWALYRASAPGDRVCLVVHTGLLGWRWYDVADRGACGDPFARS
jgi:hypothetical protein